MRIEPRPEISCPKSAASRDGMIFIRMIPTITLNCLETSIIMYYPQYSTISTGPLECYLRKVIEPHALRLRYIFVPSDSVQSMLRLQRRALCLKGKSMVSLHVLMSDVCLFRVGLTANRVAASSCAASQTTDTIH